MSYLTHSRTINQLAATVMVATIGVAVWGWMAPSKFLLKGNEELRTTNNRPSVRTKAESSELGSTSDRSLIESEVWTRNLQAGFRIKPTTSMEEKQAPKSPSSQMPLPVPPPQAPELGLRLVGTVVEQGASMAIAIDRTGKLDFCREGASLQLSPDGVRIESVAQNVVRVSYLGKAASWNVGQTLRLDIEGEVQSALLPDLQISPGIPQLQSKPGIIQPGASKPMMSIEDELDKLNGNTPSVPL